MLRELSIIIRRPCSYRTFGTERSQLPKPPFPCTVVHRLLSFSDDSVPSGVATWRGPILSALWRNGAGRTYGLPEMSFYRRHDGIYAPQRPKNSSSFLNEPCGHLHDLKKKHETEKNEAPCPQTTRMLMLKSSDQPVPVREVVVIHARYGASNVMNESQGVYDARSSAEFVMAMRFEQAPLNMMHPNQWHGHEAFCQQA